VGYDPSLRTVGVVRCRYALGSTTTCWSHHRCRVVRVVAAWLCTHVVGL
jgi:hypothetical protein